MSNYKRLRNLILFVLTLIMLALGSYNTLGTALSTEVPVVTVISPSMEPVYYRGDLLIVRGVDFDRIEVGDVVVFSRPDRNIPVVHRVVEKTDSYLATKGDNNAVQLSFEKRISPSRIKGNVVFTIPKLGYLRLLPLEFLGNTTDA